MRPADTAIDAGRDFEHSSYKKLQPRGPPHLHYGVYGAGGAYDPLPLLLAAAARLEQPGATR